VESRVQSNIHATLTGGEDIVHTLQWQAVAAGTTNPVTLGAIGTQAAASVIKNQWVTEMMKAPYPSYLSSELAYDRVSTYSYDGGGILAYQGEELINPTVGGSSGSSLPYECALVATLRTNTPGRRSRGRLYLGGFSPAVLGQGGGGADGLKTPVIADNLRDFFVAVRGATLEDGLLEFNLRPIVYSRVGDEGTPIAAVDVGRIFDAQRRRRSNQLEARVTKSLAGGD
jgi:hypothetical protein